MYYIKITDDLYYHQTETYGRFGPIQSANPLCLNHAEELAMSLAGAEVPTIMDENDSTYCAACEREKLAASA